MDKPRNAYNPLFEQALERLLVAAADSADFADGIPTGRSRQASLRRLRTSLDELHRTSAAIVLASRVAQLRAVGCLHDDAEESPRSHPSGPSTRTAGTSQTVH